MNVIKKIYCLLLVLLYSIVLQAQDNRWSVNIYDYRYDMSVYAELQYNGVAITDFSNIEVAAFVGNECRAIGVPQSKDAFRWVYFRVRSNSVAGENVVFKMYDKSNGKEYYLSSDKDIEFEADKSLGFPSSPITLLKTVLYAVSASSANDSMGSATVENYIGQAPENSNVIVKATPSVGYSFAGWTNNGQTVSTDNPYTFKITEDTRLLANFKINQYTITFDTDGGSEVASVTQDYNTAITAPVNPTKTGYTFSGWDKDIPATMPAENLTIKALWTINKYMLTYKVDGEVYKQYEMEYNAAITPEAEPTKEGYTFSGWSEIPTTLPANDVEVNGTFTINQYDVAFVADGETVKQETLDYGSAITAPENPTKLGYTFTGWSPAVDAKVPSHDVTYTAQFAINQYTITFDTDGGSEVAPVTQDYNTAITAPANPTKTGYTFTGWDKDIPTMIPAGNVTIKALWTINKYMLTYKVDGEIYKQYEMEYNSAITPEAEPKKEGYTFSGWSEIPATIPSNDVDVNGTFTINQYDVAFVVDGETVKQETQDYGSAIIAPDSPVKTGYTFMGWSPTVDAKVPAHDVTYTAQFAINQYTITFDTDGGSEIAPITQDYNTAITAPANPTKRGYTFVGWDKDVPTTIPAENLTVKATWSINQYTITFDTDGGSEVASVTQDYKTAITAPVNPTKTGYTFSGWDKDIPATMPAENVTIKALWTINKYMLTYKVDGEVYKQYELEYNAAITPEVGPTKEGYTFSGWSELPATMPANDVEVNGMFTINQYKVTFIADGEVVKVENLDYGSAITVPQAPQKTGHTFKGWGDVAETVTGDATYTAIYTVNKYRVQFLVDGEVFKTDSLEYGSAVILPEPTKEGWVFKGWGETESIMPDHDLVYNAIFQMFGDVNLDGEVNASDIVDIYNYIAFGEESSVLQENADVNLDGFVNSADATIVYNFIAYGTSFRSCSFGRYKN